MLTPEQIKNLKKGDPIVIHTTFHHVDTLGNIWVHAPSRDCGLDSIRSDYISLTTDSQLSTVNSQSKYDPCRNFKKGDRAQVVERNGRNVTCFPVGRIKVGDIVTVAENESRDVFIKVDTEDGHEMMVPWFMLELVTPVEEIGPYYIESETFDYEIRNENDDPDIGTSLALHIKFQDPDEGQILSVKSYYESYVYSREHAIDDAEAELKRLNAEWRKEQKCK